MTTLDQIHTSDWSMALDAQRDGDGLGNVVQGIDDVVQCLRIIVMTPKGTDPLRPDFSCDVYQFLDAPLNQALPSIVREVTDAIAKWETRAKVLSVLVARNDLAQLVVTLTWQPQIVGVATRALSTVITIGG